MITLINGSQKLTKSNSRYFLEYIKNELNEYKLYSLKDYNYEEIINNISISDTLVLAHPLYVDSPNTVTLEFLEYLYDNKIDLDNKSFYVIINCGFREGSQCVTALNIIKNWCHKVNLNYKGSLLIGAGEVVGNTKYHLVAKKAHEALNSFINSIKNSQNIEITTTMDLLNNKMYCLVANMSWNKKGRLNHLSKKDIKKL